MSSLRIKIAWKWEERCCDVIQGVAYKKKWSTNNENVATTKVAQDNNHHVTLRSPKVGSKQIGSSIE